MSHGGSGTYVKGIQSEDVADSIGMYFITQDSTISHVKLMEVRRVLEVQVAALAAKRATGATLVALERTVDRMARSRDDPHAFAEQDLEFHVTLARATGNELFVTLLDPFVDALYEGRRLACELPGVPEEAIKFHRDIMTQVKAGDADGAAGAMSAHLDQSDRVILRALSRDASVS